MLLAGVGGVSKGLLFSIAIKCLNYLDRAVTNLFGKL